MLIAGRGASFSDNHVRSHPKPMIIAGRGEIFNKNPIQSHLKAMIIVGRARFSMQILSGVMKKL